MTEYPATEYPAEYPASEEVVPTLTKQSLQEAEQKTTEITEKRVKQCVDLLVSNQDMLREGYMPDDVLIKTGNGHLIPSFLAGLYGNKEQGITPSTELMIIAKTFEGMLYRMGRREIVKMMNEPPRDREEAAMHTARLKVASYAIEAFRTKQKDSEE